MTTSPISFRDVTSFPPQTSGKEDFTVESYASSMLGAYPINIWAFRTLAGLVWGACRLRGDRIGIWLVQWMSVGSQTKFP